ncbi:MAG: efflux RND transporter periplasmic adaptor subunit [Pseudomonadota bacterium]
MDLARLRWTSWIVALGLIAAPQAAQAQQQAPKPAVTTITAALEDVANRWSYTGRIEAAQQIELRARVSGFIEKIGFTEGGPVVAGDILFQIEQDAYEAQITRIEGQIKSAEAEKTLADIEVDRQRKLFSTETVAESVVQRAEAEQGKVEGQILELQGSLRDAELDLSYTSVAAPFDGRVGFSEYDVGAFVGPDSGPLLQLSSIDPIYAVFPVSEAEYLDWRASNPQGRGKVEASLTLSNGSEYGESGRPEVVDTSVQEGTDTILIRAVFANPDGALLPGQLVEVNLNSAADEKSLTIPARALQRDQAGYFVLVVEDGKVARKNVETGQLTGGKMVITEGLGEGDEVIVDGIQRARPGSEVDAQPADGS